MRSIPGLSVVHTHTVGKGMVDVIAGFRGANYLFEIKDPKKSPSQRRLTEDEEKFHNEWTGQVAVVETLEDVLKILKIA
jgi:hypothetical protein